MDLSILNERIKQRRLELGFTLLQIAEILGVKEATVQRYESGEIKNIKHETILKLAKVLRCKPSYLMGWDELESEVNKSFVFEDYLRSLGYELTFEKVRESKEGFWEEHIDRDDVKVGNSFIPNEEYYLITLTGDGQRIEISSKKFELFKANIAKAVEFELFRLSQK